ncbi:hypothetical protein RsTz2092_10000 [Deferribacterales bacterium RsTz2092]|nr:hypothetical protein AGMMS49941_12490 [Deferribacterales bacterium]
MSDSVRVKRVAEMLKREIAAIIAGGVHDPRVHDVVITDVRLTNDLGIATVFFTSYVQSKLPTISAGLEQSIGFIKNQLKGRIRIRKMPQLIMQRDKTQEQAERMDELFARLNNERDS